MAGSVDAAWCRITNTNYIPTHYIFGSTSLILSATMTSPAVGTAVIFAGAVSGLIGSVVISTNATANYSNITFTNLLSIDDVAVKGDSGGCLFTFENYYPAGIVYRRAFDFT
jgi:hypothetical protein